MNYHGGMKVFSPDEMYRIHGSAMHLLTDYGLQCELSEQSLRRLAEAGLAVDFATRRVRFPEHEVLETIRQMSGAESPDIGEQGTAKPPQPLRGYKGLRCYVGANHGFVYDLASRDMRPANHQDMYDFELKNSLKGVISGGPGLYPQDVPQPVASVHAAATAVKYSASPGAPDVEGTSDLPWVERIMQASGAWPEGRHMTQAIYPVSPLRLSGRGAQMMEFQAARGDLGIVIGMVLPGASSPITLVSQTVIVIAEEIGFSTVYRLLVDPPRNRYRPHSIGDDVSLIDVRTGAYVLSGPEVTLLRLATHQIAGEFYKFTGPTGGGIRFFTDAKEPGIQASMENALSALGTLTMGVYSYEDDQIGNVAMLGALDGNLSLSLEQAVLDYELFQYLERLVKGVAVSEETLALDVIKEVGPGGVFLGHEHTAAHYRDELWFPKLLHRGAWDAWVTSGRRDPLRIARERVQDCLKRDLPLAISEERAREVDRLVIEAEQALLGTTTGLLP